MGIIPIIQHVVNSTLGTGFFMPLDKLLGAKIQIRGYSGMRFTVTNVNLKNTFSVVLTDMDELEDEETKVRYKIVPVPVGEYAIKVDSFLDSGDFTLNVKTVLGETTRISYNKLVRVATITESMQYTFQTEPVFISAIAGGGGGGGGGGCINTSNDYSKKGGGGGGGGGAGQRVENKPFWGLNGKTANITIGLGGEKGLKAAKYGLKGANGTNGEATIIEGVFTLAGGEGGEGGNPTTDKAAGGSGGGYDAGAEGSSHSGGYGAGAEGSSHSGGSGGGGGGGGIEGKGGNGGIGAGTHNDESGGQGFTGENGEGENGGIGGVGGNVDSMGADSVAGESATGYGGGGGGGGGAGGSTASNRNYLLGSDGGSGSNGAVIIYKGVAA